MVVVVLVVLVEVVVALGEAVALLAVMDCRCERIQSNEQCVGFSKQTFD